MTPAPTAGAGEERLVLLQRLEGWLERPMIVLGLVWLALVVVEFVAGLPAVLEPVVTGIWAVFIADFALRLWIAEDRGRYLRQHWLTLIALAVPAFRLLRVTRLAGLLRAGRAARGLRVARLATSLSRAWRSVHAVMARRHAMGYVVSLTVVASLAGAAGMLAFERGTPAAFEGYGHALWWTAMLLTSMGSETWPTTAEGRLLCLALAIYGFAVFGYITATIASWFIGRERAIAR